MYTHHDAICCPFLVPFLPPTAPWPTLLLNPTTPAQAHGIENTPLSPFMHSELLRHNHMYVNGSAIEDATGFEYTRPTIDVDGVRDMVEQAIAAGHFPPIFRGAEDKVDDGDDDDDDGEGKSG